MPGRTGRPRSADADGSLLAAARDLVTELGYDAVTVEMIARHAGTGRQTLYRRWPGKAELVLDALLEHAVEEVDKAADVPWREAVRLYFVDTFAALERTGPTLRSLMGHAQHDTRVRDLLRTRLIDPRRDALARLLSQGLPATAPIDTAVAALYGALWYRLLLAEPLDAAFADQLTALVLAGLATTPARSPGTR